MWLYSRIRCFAGCAKAETGRSENNSAALSHPKSHPEFGLRSRPVPHLIYSSMSDKTKWRARQDAIGRMIRDLQARPLPRDTARCSLCPTEALEMMAVHTKDGVRFFCDLHRVDGERFADSLRR